MAPITRPIISPLPPFSPASGFGPSGFVSYLSRPSCGTSGILSGSLIMSEGSVTDPSVPIDVSFVAIIGLLSG